MEGIKLVHKRMLAKDSGDLEDRGGTSYQRD